MLSPPKDPVGRRGGRNASGQERRVDQTGCREGGEDHGAELDGVPPVPVALRSVARAFVPFQHGCPRIARLGEELQRGEGLVERCLDSREGEVKLPRSLP